MWFLFCTAFSSSSPFKPKNSPWLLTCWASCWSSVMYCSNTSSLMIQILWKTQHAIIVSTAVLIVFVSSNFRRRNLPFSRQKLFQWQLLPRIIYSWICAFFVSNGHRSWMVLKAIVVRDKHHRPPNDYNPHTIVERCSKCHSF